MSKSKSQTTGYRYLFGLHMGLTRGQIDELVEIKVGDRQAWKGSVTGSQTIQINAPELFGGDKQEGGIKGTLDVLMGEPGQMPLPALEALHGSPTPAFRGVTTQFFDGQVSANTPYPKPWKMRLRRALKGWDGDAWYPERAVIPLAEGAIKAMNPAHILVECLTNRDWGRGLNRGVLDEASYRRAADTLAAENFGLCLRWTRQGPITDFMQTVLDHIGAAQYVDRGTGLITLRLIRNDYQIEELPLFDYDSGLLGIEEDEVAAFDGAINQLIVTWHDPVTDEDRQLRAQNLASIQASGQIASQSVDYSGLPTLDLAGRVATRDLSVVSAGLSRMKLRFDRRAHLLAPGSVFRIRDPFRDIDNRILRVGAFDDGKLTQGEISITALQDGFSLPASLHVEEQSSHWVPPNQTAQAPQHRKVIEASYRDLTTALDPANLAALPNDAGAVFALAERPQGGLAINYLLTTRVGSGDFRDVAKGDWCPTAVTLEAITPASTRINFTQARELDLVNVGGAALIEEEIVRVVALDLGTLSATVARGCADTVPVPHQAGVRVWFYEDYEAADPTEYTVGETVQARLLTRTSTQQLIPSLAPVDSITLRQRQARPYPPARLRINNLVYPIELTGNAQGTLTASWVSRNRKLQADQLIDSEQGGITAEAGTTYTVRWYIDGLLQRTQSGLTITSDVLTLPLESDGKQISLEVEAVRDGLICGQKLQHIFRYRAPPTN